MPSGERRNNSFSGSSSNDSDNNEGHWHNRTQPVENQRTTSKQFYSNSNSSGVDMDIEYQHNGYTKRRNETQLPSIPVVMRHPHVISSVKQYRTEDQQQQLAQPFISEAFIPMTPNVTKPTRKRRRPPFSYSSLITQAILEAENERMTLRQIYDWIVEKYPSLYNATDVGWQNTIRHNLSLNRCFKKLPKSDLDTFNKGKGGYWTIDPNHMAKFKNGAFARGSSSTLRRKPGNNNNNSKTSTTIVMNASDAQQQQEQPIVNPSTPLPSIRYIQQRPSYSDHDILHPSIGTLTQQPTTDPSPSFISTQPSLLSKNPHCDTKHYLRSPDLASSTSDSLTVMNIHNILN